MNLPERTNETGYSSSKRQENGDGPSDNNRPLKKARFAWQVKGKYDLKNEISETKCTITSIDANNAASSSEMDNITKHSNANKEQRLKTLGDLIKNDWDALDSIIKPDQPILSGLAISRENLSRNCTYSSLRNDISESVNVSKSLLLMNPKNTVEDRCITRWQAKQIVRCYMDNKVNSLIEKWMKGPSHTDIDDDTFTLFDGPQPYSISNDDSIENEGILMAISAHGLHNNSSSSSSSRDDDSDMITNKDIFLSPPSSPQSEGTVVNTNLDDGHHNFANLKTMNTVSDSFSEEISNYSCESYDQSENTPISQVGYDPENDTNIHFDLLDTAVSFAIQYKGLSS